MLTLEGTFTKSCAGADNRVDWLSKLENRERQKEKTAQRFDKIKQVENAMTNASHLMQSSA